MTEQSRKPPAPHAHGEWREKLSPDQYRVTREHGTEPPFSSALNLEKRAGIYHCVCCGAPLFTSDAKYESGSGWPSFFTPVSPEAILTDEDRSLLMRRTEIKCGQCDAHLGHVFPDGPEPTGLRYCTNGLALDFEPQSE